VKMFILRTTIIATTIAVCAMTLCYDNKAVDTSE